MKTGIAILGSTGSIGKQTLELVRMFPEKYEIIGLSAGKNITLLKEQIDAFRPHYVSVTSAEAQKEIQRQFPNLAVGAGEAGLETCSTLPEAEVVVVGIVGFAALSPTLAAIRKKKRIALANKEALVTAGPLLMQEIAKAGAQCIPVDSEHSALFQLLEGRERESVRKVILTASGGPFLLRPDLDFDKVTPAMAIAHPTWSMGAKISVDSATLMNKGLEVLEAQALFDLLPEQIEVWIHPQSIVHGALSLIDNSFLVQWSRPDMKGPIAYALSYPKRLPDTIPSLPLKEMQRLEFYPPDEKRFPCLRLAKETLHSPPSYRIALNAANEFAVKAFLEERVSFSQIPKIVEKALQVHRPTPITCIEEVIEQDALTHIRLKEESL